MLCDKGVLPPFARIKHQSKKNPLVSLPDIAVMASGSASLDVGGPILMPMEELINFFKHAPGNVVANHLEALNHCPTTRSQLKQELESNDLLSKVFILNDGETLIFESDRNNK